MWYIGTCNALNGVTRAKDNIDEDALNKELDERLNDRLDHVKQFLVRLVVLPPITLDKIGFLELNTKNYKNTCIEQRYTQLIVYF